MLLHSAGGQGGFWLSENVCQVRRLVAEVSNLRNKDNSPWTSDCSATLR